MPARVLKAQVKGRALVIGATGGVGGAVARALIADGWAVRALHRDPVRAAAQVPSDGIAWVPGDAMRQADVTAAAEGAALVFHGANPPGYRKWRELALPMLENSIAAARASSARLVFPGNVYNFGPDAGPVVTETSPQNPTTRKGRVRVEMEQMLAEAAGSRLRSLVVRAGDFLGASSSSWFTAAMVKPGKPLNSVTYPGTPDVGHAWAYLPDLARTIVRLVAMDDRLGDFEVFHFGGHWVEPGIGMAHAVRQAARRPDLPIRRFPWPLVYLAAPFVPLMRELIEMRYLWREPLRLDNAKLVGLLGTEPHTPLEEAVRETLQALKLI